MDPILAAVAAIIANVPAIVSTVDAALPFAEKIVGLIKGGDVTQDAIDQTLAAVQALSAQLQAEAAADAASQPSPNPPTA